MAPVQTEIQVEINSGSDVLELVNKDTTWKELLVGLVERNKFDPWDIDVTELTKSYLETVKKLKVIDFRLPANIILAASVLVRLKASMILLPEEEEIVDDGPAAERPNIVVDPLSLRLRVPPKRRVSLNELITALDEAIKSKEQHLIIPDAEPFQMPITLQNFDIEAETDKIFDNIEKNADKSRMITFNHLAEVSGSDDVLLGLFIPLLFLAHKEKISLIQEKFFSEIIIALR